MWLVIIRPSWAPIGQCTRRLSKILSLFWLIGNRTLCRPIWSVIILVIYKSDFWSSDFVNHSYDYRPNWTPLGPITIISCVQWGKELRYMGAWSCTIFTLCKIHTGAHIHNNCGRLLSGLIFFLGLSHFNAGLTGNKMNIHQRLHAS